MSRTERQTKRDAARLPTAGCLAFLLLPGLLLTPLLQAAPSFHGDQSFPALGLRFRPLAQATPAPLPPPKTWNYTWHRGDEEGREERFDPLELWRATQHGAAWRDNRGNRLVVARVTTLPPRLTGEHVSRATFEAAMADDTSRLDPASKEDLLAWLAAFTESQPAAPVTLKVGPNLTAAHLFPGNNGRSLALLFQVKRRYQRRTDPHPLWYCATLTALDNTPAATLRQNLEQQFLPHITALESPINERDKQLQPGGVRHTAEQPDSEVRQAARRSIANLEGWWSADAASYILLSDLKSATGRALVRELQQALPSIQRTFTKLVPPFEQQAPISVVRIFANGADYRNYVDSDFAWSSGLWSAAHRELVILGEDRNRAEIMRIIRHEGFHQYLFHATAMLPHAIWYNEGHACLFEGLKLGTGSQTTIDETERVRYLLDNLPAVARHLPVVLAMSPDDFYGGNDETRQLNYATAWGLVYFLRKGAPANRLHNYRNVLESYLESLRSERDGLAATATAFKAVDNATLQRDFIDFWRRGRAAARRYNPR